MDEISIETKTMNELPSATEVNSTDLLMIHDGNGVKTTNVGAVIGTVPVDGAVNLTSTNAVQNKVITKYVNDKTVADSAISSTSTNAVQNKVVYNELAKKVNADNSGAWIQAVGTTDFYYRKVYGIVYVMIQGAFNISVGHNVFSFKMPSNYRPLTHVGTSIACGEWGSHSGYICIYNDGLIRTSTNQAATEVYCYLSYPAEN